MSAYVVSKKHIDTIVSAWISMAEPSHDNRADRLKLATQVGQMLWNENYRSVNRRYNEKSEPLVYRYTEVSLPPTSAMLLPLLFKALDCYDYQCCETSDWEETQAFRFVSRLRREAWKQIPGYETASWDIPN